MGLEYLSNSEKNLRDIITILKLPLYLHELHCIVKATRRNFCTVIT